MTRARLLPFAVLALATSASLPVLAQGDPAVRALVERVESLQREMIDLQRQLYQARGGVVPPGAPPAGAGVSAASIDTTRLITQDLPEMRDQVRQFTGQVEKIEHDIGAMKARLDKLVNDVDFRLSRIEADLTALKSPIPGGPSAAATAGQSPAGMAGADPQAAGPRPSGAPGVLVPPPGAVATQQGGQATPRPAAIAALPEGTPKERYDYAIRLLRQQDYEDAAKAFRAFIEVHPKDALAPNAFYWLGETHYVRGDNAVAARAFLDGYKAAPKGDKAPDNLLKLGMSLANLKQNAEACNTFGQLAGEFPSAAPNIKQSLTRERQRAGCK
ncbi:MAG: tol-pal system protein YbgF [Alphaproteobacteria bacterium]|nr:tol-pal system protein YbgF [Alphaproteobacteria bacterium]